MQSPHCQFAVIRLLRRYHFFSHGLQHTWDHAIWGALKKIEQKHVKDLGYQTTDVDVSGTVRGTIQKHARDHGYQARDFGVSGIPRKTNQKYAKDHGTISQTLATKKSKQQYIKNLSTKLNSLKPKKT